MPKAGIAKITQLLKQERNSNQARALLGQSNMGTDQPTNKPTDQPTDRRTDKVSYRGACSRLKTQVFKQVKMKARPFYFDLTSDFIS
jgi:hypothetical protein